VNEGLVNL